MNDNLRVVIHFFGIGTVALLVFGLTYLEYFFMYSNVIPYAGTSLDMWVDDFVIAAQLGVYVTVGLVLLWYILAHWSLKVISWQNGGKRLLWLMLGIVSVAVSVGIGFAMTERTQAGGGWAWIFYAMNPLILYYFATVLFSPTAYKYTAFLASYIRRWW